MKVLRCLAIVSAVLTTSPAYADAVSDFYKGKEISLYVSFPPGGGYDIYARFLAPHFERHIPGHPRIVIKNMEGGSGVRAASFISKLTPQDGLSLGLFLDTLTLGKVLGGPGEFNPSALVWIGRLTPTATVSVAWHTSKVQSVEAAKREPIIIAGSIPANSSVFIPRALNDLAGTKFKIILGYQGSPPMAMAMERGEVDAIGGISWEAIQSEKRDWLDEHKITILYSQGARRIEELPGIPGLLDFASDARSRVLLSLLGSGQDIGRSIVAEPGIPVARAAALRKAFMETMSDPAYVAEAKRRSLTVGSLSGEEVQKIVEADVRTPADILDQARRYVEQP